MGLIISPQWRSHKEARNPFILWREAGGEPIQIIAPVCCLLAAMFLLFCGFSYVTRFLLYLTHRRKFRWAGTVQTGWLQRTRLPRASGLFVQLLFVCYLDKNILLICEPSCTIVARQPTVTSTSQMKPAQPNPTPQCRERTCLIKIDPRISRSHLPSQMLVLSVCVGLTRVHFY